LSKRAFPKALKPLEIALAGGGIGGITAAMCLARAGHAVTVFEQADAFVESGAGVQISPNASRVLHALGLEESLCSVGVLPEATEIRSWRNGRVISRTPLGFTAQQRYGAPYYHVHRGDLLQLLVEEASGLANVELVLGRRVSTFKQDSTGVSVDLGDEARVFDVLIGADGIHSAVQHGMAHAGAGKRFA
jgi:salicylate hydroxylase